MIRSHLGLRYLREVLGVQYFLYPKRDSNWGNVRGFREGQDVSLKGERNFSNFSLSKRGSLNGKWLFITEKGLQREDFEVLDRLVKALGGERNFLQILVDGGEFRKTLGEKNLEGRGKESEKLEGEKRVLKDFEFEKRRFECVSFLKFFLLLTECRFGIFFGKDLFHFLTDPFCFDEREVFQDFFYPYLNRKSDLNRENGFHFPFISTYALSEFYLKKGQKNGEELFLRKKAFWKKVKDLVLDSSQ